MSKKKSKTQKSKKNQRKKVQATQKAQTTTKTQPSNKTPKKTNQTPKKKEVTTKEQQPKKTVEKKQVVDKKQVKYNVALDTKTIKKPDKEKQLVDKDKVKYNVVLTEQQTPKDTNVTKQENKYITNIKKALTKAKEFFNKLKSKKKEEPIKTKKYVKKDKNNKKQQEVKPKNIFLRALYDLRKNFHILFNSALIVTYIILLIGLIRTNAFSTGTIIYISCIVIFLMIVAIGYNKYISGKIFSLMIIAGMSLGIYHMQYTYDFINNLNSNEYEYKTYFVVTFNNGQNKSIYNINNKKVCLLKDNSVNIERKLNTKLDSIIYIEHDDPNQLYKDFYNTDCRAIIVNENQYKYLVNNIEKNSRNIKILYEFKANGKK